MKKNVFTKVLALCLVLLLSVGMMAGCGKKQLTAKEHFDLAVTTKEAELNNGVISLYGTMENSMSSAEGTTADLKISLGDAAKKLIESAAGEGLGISFDWLNEIGLKVGTVIDKGVVSEQMGVSLNGTPIATIGVTVDTENQKTYVTVPELLSETLSVDTKKALEEAGGEMGGLDFSKFMDVKSWMPDDAAIKSIIDRYTKVILENVTEVTKEEAAVEAGGVSQKCSKLVASLSEETLNNIAKALADAIEKDTELAGVLDKVGALFGFAGSDIISEMAGNIRKGSVASGTKVQLVIFSDDDGNMAGLELSGGADGEENTVLKIASPKQDGKTALDVEILVNGKALKIAGTGTSANGKASGNYAVSLDGAELLTIEAADFDEEAAKKNLSNGSVTLKFSKGLADLAGDEAGIADMLTQFAVKFDSKMTDSKNGTFGISVLDGSNTKFVGIDGTVSAGTDVKAVVPAGKTVDTSDEDAISGLMSSINFDSLINSLKAAGVPEDLTNTLSMIAAMMSGGSDLG